MLLEAPKKLCSKCNYETKIIDFSLEIPKSIWEFDPLNYEPQDIHEKLCTFINTIPKDSLFSLNNDGFTYTQWQVFWLGKSKYRIKKYYKSVMNFFKSLEECLDPETFGKMLWQGSLEDPKHTTLHHYFEYCETFCNEWFVKNMCSKYGLTMYIKNSEEKTPLDFRKEKGFPYEKRKIINSTYAEYKKIEKDFKKQHRDLFPEKCEKCNEILNYFDSIHLVTIDNFWREKLLRALLLRQKVFNIFSECSSETLEYRHQYVIDVYKKILKIENLSNFTTDK